MLGKVLRKDLKKRKGVNIILCLFIFLATVFLSSSLNNILSVTNGIEFFLDYANIPGLTLFMDGTEERERTDDFLKTEKSVKDYEYAKLVTVAEENLAIIKNGKESAYDSGGVNIYLGDNKGKYCQVYDVNNKEVSMKKGEAALNVDAMESNNLKPGDKLVLKENGKGQEFTIKCAIKDAAFGSKMSGMSRIIFSREDLEEILSGQDHAIFGTFLINTDDVNGLSDKVGMENLTSIVTKIDRDMYKLLYVMDMVLAALLILIGVCFILIAFLVLRFTLVFTMEENYCEIGIMQAIGLRNFAIRRIYLVKYLLLVTVGAAAGLIVSIPVSKTMLDGVSKNIVLTGNNAYMWANLAGALFVAAAVLLFCYRCTKRIEKISPIEAIRGGQSGERYHKRKGMKLYSRERMPVPVFLGLNDITSHIRRYLVLLITFCISFVLISIPLNTVNTMKSDEMVSKFSLDPDSAVYMNSFDGNGAQFSMSVQEMDVRIEKLKEDLTEKGYEADFTIPYVFNFIYYDKNESKKTGITTVQINGNADYLTYSEGTAPELENEIALSRHILDTNGWKIGDTVHTVINNEEMDFIVTGTYSDYLQLGNSARMNPVIDLTSERISFFWSLMLHMDTTLTQQELKEELTKALPEYTWSTAHEILDTSIGSIQSILDSMLLPMTILLCGIIALIAIMMEQLFIVREKGEIAMMKSIGFSDGTIRLWQVIRMVWVVFISMIAAVPLSMLSNHFLLKPVFGIMGAEINIQVNNLQAYVIYPGILLIVIILATILASRKVKKISIQELNNLE